MADTFDRPEDYFEACLAKMADQRLLGLNAIRSNPNCVGYSLTGTVDQGMTGEAGGLMDLTFYRELIPDLVWTGQEPPAIRNVAVRTRPILLTAGTTLLGNWVITLDPIFAGLAWAIIFGILASTLFTLLVIPVVYWLLYGGPVPSPRQ